MFSPKVLDRAHVLELSAERPSAYLLGSVHPEPGGTIGIAKADELLQLGIDDRENQRHAVSDAASILDALTDAKFTQEEIDAIKRAAVSALDGCYDLLTPVGFAFGYRVSKEVFVYLSCWIQARQLAGASKADVLAAWPGALDNAVLQKILPKIHGNRRALGDSLRALSSFLGGQDGNSNPPASYALGTTTRIEIPPERRLTLGSGHFRRSKTKLDVMHDRLVATGYVSFVS